MGSPYQLPVELEAYLSQGCKVSYSLTTGIVDEESFALPASKMSRTQGDKVIYNDGEPKDIQEQVWMSDTKDDSINKYAAVMTSVDLYFTVGDQVTFVVSEGEGQAEKFVLLYNHNTDETLYLEDVDDSTDRINPLERSRPLEYVWMVSAALVLLIALTGFTSGSISNTSRYLSDFMIIGGMSCTVLLLDVKKLFRGTFLQMFLVFSFIVGGFAAAYNPEHNYNMLIQFIGFGGLLALLPTYIIYFSRISLTERTFRNLLLDHLNRIAVYVDQADGHKRTEQSAPAVASMPAP